MAGIFVRRIGLLLHVSILSNPPPGVAFRHRTKACSMHAQSLCSLRPRARVPRPGELEARILSGRTKVTIIIWAVADMG